MFNDALNALEILIQVCRQRQIHPHIVQRPQHYRDGISVTKRRIILREMHSKGLSVAKLMLVCPVSERTIWDGLKVWNWQNGRTTKA